MITKLHNHAFRESIYDILRDNESLTKVDTGVFDDKFRIRYKRNSKETVYYSYKTEEQMISDFKNFTILNNIIRDFFYGLA
jgi:hypothetical protein